VVYYGYDFISDLSFGRSFELLDHADNRYVPDVLKSASKFLYYVGYLSFAAIVRPLMGTSIQDYFPGQSAKDSLKYTRLANSRLGERIDRERKSKDSEPSRKDVFHYLLNSKDPKSGRGFTTEEIQADTSLLIAAGSDGVSLAVSALIFYLLQKPKEFSKLTDEIRSAFSEPSQICNPALSKLPYLNACVEESLRLCPPKPGSLPRIVLAGGTQIDGHYIPAGTMVGVAHYVIHRNSEYFSDANSFMPERWIIGSGISEEEVAGAKRAFCPFGIGPMNCVGKNMAYLATKLAVAYLLFHFDIRQDGELVGGGSSNLEKGRRDKTEYQLWDWIIGFPKGPIVQLRARN
jgi:cytochrome P450